MITYLIKMTLCALLLYAIYVLLLEMENRHRFKRVYLLAGLIFSLLVPFLVIEISIPKIPVNLEMFYNIHPNETIISEKNQHYFAGTTTQLVGNISSTPVLNYYRLLLAIYTTITTLLMFRLFRNYLQILVQARENDSLPYRDAKIVLVKEKVVPHSFGQYIFINKEDYYSGLVPEEIVAHELAHVRQRHTYDILFVELLITFGWFNPVFYLYRNKIKQNHEFLADDAVVGNDKAIVHDYFSIIISQIPYNKKISFTSNFNFLITKKRLIMMTKTTSKRRLLYSTLALIPVFIAAIFFFSTKIIAQNDMNELPEQTSTQDNTQIVTSSLPQNIKLTDIFKDDISMGRYKEYNQIIDKNRTVNDKGVKMLNLGSFSKEELDRMKELFLSMTPEQQNVLSYAFKRRSTLFPVEKTPAKEQFESWKDPAQYGVWIDGKRIENSELNRYQASDFSHYSVSRLARNAKNYGKHVYQLDLETTKYYKKRKAEAEADETLYLMHNIPINKNNTVR